MPDAPRPEPEILNPRYAGATPEMVARALLRHGVEKPSGDADSEPRRESSDDGNFQQCI